MTVDLLVLLGIDPALAHLLGNIVAAVFVAMLIAMIWRGREPVARLIRGGAPQELPEGAPAAQRLRNLLATMWPGLAILYVLVLWAMSEITDLLGYELAAHAGIWSLLLVIAVPLIDAAIGHGIRAYVEARHGLSGDEAAAYGRVAHRAARILLIVGAVAIFARLWGINLFDFAARRDRRAGCVDAGRRRPDAAGRLRRLGAREDRDRPPARARGRSRPAPPRSAARAAARAPRASRRCCRCSASS